MLNKKGGFSMFYSTYCNYIVKIIGKDSHIECYTKEQLKNNIRHENGCIVYKVLNNGKLEKCRLLSQVSSHSSTQQGASPNNYFIDD